MTTVDPYTPPRTPGGDAWHIPPGAFEAIRGFRPWVRFLSIVAFLASGFHLFAGVMTLRASSSWALEGPLGVGDAEWASALLKSALLYLLVAILSLLAAVVLHRYARRIGRLADDRAQALVDALDEQRRLWRLAGILVPVAIVAYAVLFGASWLSAATGL